jgi:DNA polymerase
MPKRKTPTPALIVPIERAVHAIPELAAARDPAAAHVLNFDYETRSHLDLTVVGTSRYAAHPTTDVTVVGYAVDDEPVQIWSGLWADDPVPPEFIEAANNPAWITVAHNDYFERSISRHILEPCYGFPAIPLERRRCTMAAARAMALPGALEDAAEALGLPFKKDTIGKKLMLAMSAPRPDGSWIEDEASREGLYAYNRQDVEAERAVFKVVPLLIEAEQIVWQHDQIINDRGFHTDGELLEAALEVVTVEGAKRQAEFRDITGLKDTNQLKQWMAWLAARNCIIKDAQKATISAALRRKDLAPEVRRSMELRRQLAHASVNKIVKMLSMRDVDGRVRGALAYHGASTGRWTSFGVQIQNFKRDGERTEQKIAGVLNGGAGLASPVEAVGDIARAMVCAAPSHKLMIADFSGIESRMLAWIAGEHSKLEQWQRFDQTNDPRDEPYWVQGKRCSLSDDKARPIGKTMDLSFGFGGGPNAWWKAPGNEDDDTPKEIVQRYCETWRAMHPRIKQFWYKLNDAAIGAVKNPGTEFHARGIMARCDGPHLKLRLPGGRSLSYPFAHIGTGRFGHDSVVFEAIDSNSKQWTEYDKGFGAWHGVFVENVVSGACHDVLWAAMQRLEAAGYKINFTVHDEIVCEVPIDFGSLEEFKQLMIEPPAWAADLPIAAKVREGLRFSKDEPAVETVAIAGADFDDRVDDISVPVSAHDCGSAGIKPAIASADLAAKPVPPADLGVENGGNDDENEANHSPRRQSTRNGGNGAAIGNGYCSGKILCPFHDDHTPNLQIYPDENDPHYHCFVCHAHGHLDDLPVDWETLIAPVHQQTDDARKLAFAHELWDEAKPITGTLAEQYLAEVRGIDVGALPPDIDKTLRFHLCCPFNGSRHPCLIALFRDIETDEAAGIHRIALTTEAQKIERRMLGRWPQPRAVKIWPVGTRLFIGEGIETSLAAATRLNDRGALMQPAWAAGSVPKVVEAI